MGELKLMEILGKAFADGAVDELEPLLAENCEYVSERANRKIKGAEDILACMKAVYEYTSKADTKYTYTVAELPKILRDKADIFPAIRNEDLYISKYALFLYHSSTNEPETVVVCQLNTDNKLQHILLSRNKAFFNVSFFGSEIENDSPADLPSTVEKLHKNAGYSSSVEDNGCYIWRKADEYLKKCLSNEGYTVLETVILENCIAYRCQRNFQTYTVFMFAYGKKKPEKFDEEFYSKLFSVPTAANSTILVLYLNVERYMESDGIKYRINNYYGSEMHKPEFWQLRKINDKYALIYYPRQELVDRIWHFMYAFNRKSADIYNLIIAEHNPSITGYPSQQDMFLNDAFYNILRDLHLQYGNMKLGYVRYNDMPYYFAPYLDGFGFFAFHVNSKTNLIDSVTCYPFENSKSKIAEFVKTKEREADNLFSFIPKLIDALPLAPTATERFAVKLTFDNGECRKYLLPITPKENEKKVVAYLQHVFTDKIWKSISVVSSHPCKYNNYPPCGPAITFKNGLFIAGTLCYLESKPYIEAEDIEENMR